METACPGCAHIYKVPDNVAGKKTRCKKCNEVFQIEPFVELDLQEDPNTDIPDAAAGLPEKRTPPRTSMLLLFSAGAAVVVFIVLVILQGVFGILMDDSDWFLVPPLMMATYVAVALYMIEKNRSETFIKSLCIGFFAFMALTYYTSYQFSSPDFPALAKPDHDKFEAYVMSQQFVEDRLKAPASADFPTTSQADIRHLGGGRYQVVSYVDSQNAFGAMIRNHYTCELHTDDGDRWTCDTLVFDPS